ncbi:MAG: 3,4-dihydroxy-2-butanone-4-phosphate synthase [Bacteriovoracaceae bacterium]|nr:3,4-dihydroxy-2-butanone-4-phosphate synthase [Bacteriovoracaceae bacterium]
MLNKIEEAVIDIENGKMVIVVDDENRENEGDLIMAAEKVKSEDITFMANFGKGLICAPVSASIASKYQLDPMVNNNDSVHSTAFTVSIDSVHGGTGISSDDRALTIKTLVDDNLSADDLCRPGHIFPLIAKDAGVLERPGHTEAAVDLAKMAGFKSVGVICEILNEDGTLARLPQLIEFSKKHDLKIISIEDLIDYKRRIVVNSFYTTAENHYGPNA